MVGLLVVCVAVRWTRWYLNPFAGQWAIAALSTLGIGGAATAMG